MRFSRRRTFVLVFACWFVASVSLGLAWIALWHSTYPRSWLLMIDERAATASLWPIGGAISRAVFEQQGSPVIGPGYLRVYVTSLAIGAFVNSLYWAAILTGALAVIRQDRRFTQHAPPPPPAADSAPSR